MAGSSGSIWVSLGLTTQNFQKGIKGARGQLSGFQKFTQGLKGMFNPFTIGVGAVAALGTALTDAFGIFKDFEKANSKLEAVLRATDSEMEALTKQSKKLGSVTAFTASEVAELQTEFAKLGFPTDDILDMTEATLDGAAALGSELGEQAALAGATLKQYGLDSSEAARVNDVLAESAASSALDFSKLATALPIVGATANTAGVSLERTTALLGTLSNRGLDASSAATALRNIFLELSKQGITWEQAMNKINTATDKNAVAMDLFGKRGATAGVILAETGASTADLEEKLKSAEGAAKDMAETMLDNLSGDITKAGSAWEGFILSLEDGEGAIAGVSRGVTQSFTSMLNGMTELIEFDFQQTTESARQFGDQATELGNIFLKIVNPAAAEYATTMRDDVAGGLKKADDIMKGLTETQLRSSFVMGEQIKLYKEQGLTSEEITKRFKDQAISARNLAKSEKEAAENAKLLAETSGGAEDEVIKLTAAQKKAAIEARNLANNLDDVLNVTPLPKGLTESVQKILKDVSDEMPALAIPAAVELEVGSIDAEKILPKVSEQFAALGERTGQVLVDSFKAIASEAFSTIGTALGQAFAGGDFSQVGAQFMAAVGGIVSGIGEQMIALGIAALLAKDAIKSLFANPALAIGAGVALVAIGAAMSQLLASDTEPQGFAEGGLVTGSVFANIGEGRGTTRSNPEVIAPLDKLQGFMPQGGGMGGEVRFRIEGNTLVGILNRTNKSSNFSS